MNEYMITIRVDTQWHAGAGNPNVTRDTTTSNTYTEFQSANSAKEAVRNELATWSFSNPNKSVHVVKVQKL